MIGVLPLRRNDARAVWRPGFQHASRLLKWVAGAAIGTILTIVVGARVTEVWAGPEYYKVYVIGMLHGGDEGQELFESIHEGVVPNLTIDGKPIKIEKRDDQGDPQVAARIARDIAAREDTLLVIGHAWSTQTKAALPHYLGAPTPVPIILPTETNPDLLPANVVEGSCPPAMRLSPTDDRQAETAAAFAISRASNFWVVSDTDNRVYAEYLAERFIANVNDWNRKGRNKKVVLRSTTDTLPPLDSIRALNVDGVYFAGGWSNALVLIRQIEAFFANGPKPIVILSDGTADNALLKTGRTEVEGVFLTHPLKATDHKSGGYALYGKDAFRLLTRVITRANRHFDDVRRAQSPFSYWTKWALNMHHVTDARAVLGDDIRKAVTVPRSLNMADCVYLRKTDGSENNAAFHVWQIQDGEFKDQPFEGAR